MNDPELSHHETAEMAIAVLRATDDGNELAPVDLKLVELAVNRNLNASGLSRFHEFHENATKPEGYTAPWLFGVEHLTIDLGRNIRWKGVTVEHFDHGVWQRLGWREQMRADAEAVAVRCRELEAAGIQPTLATATDW